MGTPGIGFGATLERSSDATSGGVFSSVGDVFSITPPNLTREVVDVTHMASTERWREFIGGLKDAGEMTAEINMDPSDAASDAFLSDLNTDTAGYYKLTWFDADEWGFAAFVTGIAPENPLDDKVTVEVTFRLTGKPDFVA